MYLYDREAGVSRSVSAYRLFDDFFQAFGIAGAFIPGVALVTVLLAWHIMAKDRWRIDYRTLAGMLAESLAWTMPLLVLSAANNHARESLGVLHTAAAPGDWTALAAGSGQSGLFGLPTGAKATIAIGAGLYEEMLFRLVGLAVLHFILVDLIGLTQRWGSGVAIVLAALAFAVYHQPALPREWANFVFITLAGIYFGTVYVMRGFGIVVATHAIYDLLVLIVFDHGVQT